MSSKTPSRILNIKPGFLGLSIFDYSLLGYLLLLIHAALEPLGWELLSFLLTLICFIILVSIRVKFRPKVIRDYLAFIFSKRIFYKGVYL